MQVLIVPSGIETGKGDVAKGQLDEVLIVPSGIETEALDLAQKSLECINCT